MSPNSSKLSVDDVTAYCLAQQPTKPSKYVYAFSFQTLQVVASGCARPLLQPLIRCRKG